MNNLRIELKEALTNMWNRISARIEAIEEGGGEANVIEAISFNGTDVPPDANKRVSMSESDPTVPSWAKQSSKPGYTAAEVGALPANTTYVSGVKGVAESAFRSGNVTLKASDVAALAKGSYGNLSYIVRYLKNADISQADNGVSTGTSISGAMIGIDDGAGNSILDLVGEVFKTGAVRYKFMLHNIGASPVLFGGYVDLNKDGTASLFFSHPDEIRDALEAKKIQTPVADPTASGNAVAFIDSITQDAQGVISATKKTVPAATQSAAGLMSAADKTKLDNMPAEGVPGRIEINLNGLSITDADEGGGYYAYEIDTGIAAPSGFTFLCASPIGGQWTTGIRVINAYPRNGTICYSVEALKSITITRNRPFYIYYLVQ